MSKSPEQFNEAIQETTGNKSEVESGYKAEVVHSPELDNLSSSLEKVQEAIDTDQDLTVSNLLTLKEAVGKIKVEIGGEEFTLEEVKDSKEMKKNIKIWKEIETSNKVKSDIIYELTLITPKIANILSEYKGYLALENLKSISVRSAMALSNYNGGKLHFDSLKSISTEVANAFCEYKGDLWLTALTSISKDVAEALSNHVGSSLALSRIESISDEIIKILTKHKGGLDLGGLKTLSNQAAEILGDYEGWLALDGLESISNDAAEALSSHKNNLSLSNLIILSDEAAKSLGKHDGNINLTYLSSISDKGLNFLAMCKGHVYIHDRELELRFQKYRKRYPQYANKIK